MSKLVVILAISICSVRSQTFTVYNETFPYEYIFEKDHIGNYTDHVVFCRSLHNAELIKFNSTQEYDFIVSTALGKGSFIIGLYIPANGDYRNLTWFDDTPVDLDRVQLKFRSGLPAYSSSFRYYYTRSAAAELASGNYYGGAICKRMYVDATTTTTSETTTVTSHRSSLRNNATPINNHKKLSFLSLFLYLLTIKTL